MKINSIKPAEAKKRMAEDKSIVLVDVRGSDEYATGHIPGSVLIPLDIIDVAAATRLPDKNATIFVYCRSGARSDMAAKILTNLGYANIYNMGGIMSWPFEVVR